MLYPNNKKLSSRFISFSGVGETGICIYASALARCRSLSLNAFPRSLGRSVVVSDGAEAPEAWRETERVVVDGLAADAAIERLHQAWFTRTPVVIDLRVDPATFRNGESVADDVWSLSPGLEIASDALQFLVWANTYDFRTDELIWWWGRKASRLGARVEGVCDVVLPDGTPVWIDGGPRGSVGATVDGRALVHSESVDAGNLRTQPDAPTPAAELAPDQAAAVAHGFGPARVIAPAGSGKTRVLTEHYRHLLEARRYEPESTIALAYNKKAQEEMTQRLTGLSPRIHTLNAWGYALLARARRARLNVIDERGVRDLVEGLLPAKVRRLNTDPYGPYIDGLSLIRLGLRDPEEVEASLDDVDGLASIFDPYRAELQRRGVIDFDEQIYGTLEHLLRDGAFRRDVQREHRHVLVDEFQDLTPAHLLLVRLAAGPSADVFGVGDDDQSIYGHAGADPRFLIDYARYFRGASMHDLRVNYRCPVAVTVAARTLLGYNETRVPKTIESGPGVVADPAGFAVELHEASDGASAARSAVTEWLGAGATPEDVAVLARVQSLLLAPHVALSEAGVPVNSILSEWALDRVGVKAALAYLRIAISPTKVRGNDFDEVRRRPSRGLPQWASKWLAKCRTIDGLRDAADRIDDEKVADKFRGLAEDLDLLAGIASRGASARELLVAVRDKVGLGTAMSLLDSTGAAGGSHLDDIEGLIQVADLQPVAAQFEPWLRDVLRRPATEGGVTLSTIHRVKGREWDHVVVYGVTDGLMPHRLAEDVEEERRVLHVAITRGIKRVAVLGDVSRRSEFIDELDGTAVARPRAAAKLRPTAEQRRSAPKPVAAAVVEAEVGLELRLTGGYEGLVVSVTPDGVSVRLSTGSAMTVRFGERVQHDGAWLELGAPPSPLDDAAAAALKAWRAARAKADGMPAYIVLNDKYLEGIAKRRPSTLTALRACDGIGPAKLETYGDEILAVIAQLTT